MKPGSRTRDRLLYLLKTRGAHSAQDLAERLDLTSMAVRLQLDELRREGLVESFDERLGVGRPRRYWELTEAGNRFFPEGYADLALDILDGARHTFGAEGVQKLLNLRLEQQLKSYRKQCPLPDAPLAKRVAALAKMRRQEGYMAEWRKSSDGSFRLIENHCPICVAAESCVGLCSTELELFQRLLGQSVEIHREEHILAGARRCTYRIAPK